MKLGNTDTTPASDSSTEDCTQSTTSSSTISAEISEEGWYSVSSLTLSNRFV